MLAKCPPGVLPSGLDNSGITSPPSSEPGSWVGIKRGALNTLHTIHHSVASGISCVAATQWMTICWGMNPYFTLGSLWVGVMHRGTWPQGSAAFACIRVGFLLETQSDRSGRAWCCFKLSTLWVWLFFYLCRLLVVPTFRSRRQGLIDCVEISVRLTLAAAICNGPQYQWTVVKWTHLLAATYSHVQRTLLYYPLSLLSDQIPWGHLGNPSIQKQSGQEIPEYVCVLELRAGPNPSPYTLCPRPAWPDTLSVIMGPSPI